MSEKRLTKKIELDCVGLQYALTQSTRKLLAAHVKSKPIPVEFEREPDNPADENAIVVYGGGIKEENPYADLKLGYIPRLVAEVLAPELDKGTVEFGTSLMTSVDTDRSMAEIQAKLRIRRNLKLELDRIA